MCRHTCVCVHVHMCIWRSEVNIKYLSQLLLPFILKNYFPCSPGQGLSLNPELTNWLDWLASKFCSAHVPSRGFQTQEHHSQLFTWVPGIRIPVLMLVQQALS